MGVFDEGLDRRRQYASAFVEANLEPGESVVALLPWSVYKPERSAARRVWDQRSVAAAGAAAAGQPRGLAVTDGRLLIFDYPRHSHRGAAATVAKSIFKERSLKGGLASLEDPPEQLAAAYRRSEVSVREWTEAGKRMRELELKLPSAESLRLKVAKVFWEDAESVLTALGHRPTSE